MDVTTVCFEQCDRIPKPTDAILIVSQWGAPAKARRIALMIAFVCLVSEPLSAQDRLWINPGLRISYAFGEKGGMTIGPEISVVWEVHDGMAGIVVDLDFCDSARRTKLHVGFERHPLWHEGLVGVCIGPTLIWEHARCDPGFTITPYTGFMFIPFTALTIRGHEPSIFELGGDVKYPWRISGPAFHF